MTTSSETPDTAAETELETREERRRFVLEVWIVVLLGVVSVATAYASFQSALYDGMQAASYSEGQNAQTEAESLYLEANQQYIQDAQTLSRLVELGIAAESSDPVAAATAQETYDAIYFMNVSEDLDAAIQRAEEANAADPENYTSPLDDEDYQAALYGAWAETDDKSEAIIAQGNVYNGYGDRLTLTATLMAITLFLLGVAAVVRRDRTKIVLIGVGVAIFVVAAVLTALVPFTWL
ncbi:hypothetical protein H4J02_00065 [Protaetiibacter sp. SSC-01]|uniref:hypothetical protein n=1 Tax=Protaetiibacter sp. SSC-01 TaxID=2759943 RepID=UPI0016574D1D|nr:hypothetical protein [Protaetiibacter sp. SSC-01]QNO37493.1 hypothetical protein H4J02_00065 [Protaetiibacter sp. SSC-01]